MNLKLKRDEYKESGVFGRLFREDGIFLCRTLEHSYLITINKANPKNEPISLWKAKLPPGTYKCVRGDHRLHSGPIHTFEVTGVPGHTGILLHKGNTQNDSEGCILVGMVRLGDKLGSSTQAFEQFMILEAGINEFTLEVV